MVVKPMDFVARGRRGLAQPALGVRGREYLRIIYGPEYAEPPKPRASPPTQPRSQALARVTRVRAWSRGARTVRAEEPLRRVDECCFGVLALESEPVDPRL
jgi:protein phosphatase